MDENTCRELLPVDVEQAAEVLARAFVNDPLCVYMLPIAPTRIRTLKKFFRAYGTVNIQNLCGYGVGMPLVGVAYWLEPSKPDPSISLKTLGLFLPLIFTLYPLGLFRAKAIVRQTDQLHQKYAAEPHYYLDNLGVLPIAQGKGMSSRLIRPFLKKADDERVTVYTDTVTRDNVSLYEHFGFHCMEELKIERTGITVWALLRPVQ